MNRGMGWVRKSDFYVITKLAIIKNREKPRFPSFCRKLHLQSHIVSMLTFCQNVPIYSITLSWNTAARWMVHICDTVCSAVFHKQSSLYFEDSRTSTHVCWQRASKQSPCVSCCCEQEPPATGISLSYSRGVSPPWTFFAQVLQLFSIT